MFHAGKHPPRLLLVLFTLWVLSPFVALLVAFIFSKRWSPLIRSALYALMLVVALVSMAIYADITVVAPMARPTPVFVMVPPVSWLLIAAVLARAALISRRRSSDSA
jgi:glucose-6-phosphate-specific signal transduction histidine kinase